MRRLFQFAVLAALLTWCASARATTTITRVGSCVGTTSCTPPAHQASDFFIAFAFRDGSTTAPTLPAGWLNIDTNGANTSSYRMACKLAAGASETASGFTNATELVVVVYRGVRGGNTATCAGSSLGAQGTEATAASATLTYNTVTFQHTDGSSWTFACGGHRTATDVEQAPTATTNITSTGTEIACHDSNGGVTGFTGATVGVNASSGWHTKTVEIRACITQICLVSLASTTATGSASSIATSAYGHAAGNLLAIGVGASSDTVTVNSVTNTASDTCVQATSTRITSTGDFSDVWYCKNITGNAADIVTANLSGAVSFRDITVAEYIGADTTSPFEVGTTGLATGTTVTSSSFSPAAANNINFAHARAPGGNSTWTAGTNYILLDSSAANGTWSGEHRLDAPSGAQTASITFGTSITNFKISVASFKVAGGGGGGGTVIVPQQMLSGVGN